MGSSEARPVTRELIREYLGGDAAAFRLLLERQQPSVLHYAGGFLPDAAEAQEVARKALRRGFRQLPRLRRNSLLSSFMLGILRSELRKRGNRAAPDDVDPLWAGLAGLPRVQREVVFLHFQGMALRQVALVRSEAPGLTFSRFGKALCHVAKKLFGEPGTAPATPECPTEERLYLLLSGALDGDDRRVLETHIAECAECGARRERAELLFRRVREDIGAAAAVAPLLSEIPGPSPLTTVLASAGILLLAAAAFFLLRASLAGGISVRPGAEPPALESPP